MEQQQADLQFCQTFLNTFDPERAASLSHLQDGFQLLDSPRVQERLEKMRTAAAGQLRREDVLRRLAQLAFGRANDAVYLALHPKEADLEQLDLSAVSECKVSDKGGVEFKLLDRVRALETLCRLLESHDQSAGELCQLLADSNPEGVWDDE